MTLRWPSTAETCSLRLTNKIRSSDSCVLTDTPTHICVKHNGDEQPEDIFLFKPNVPTVRSILIPLEQNSFECVLILYYTSSFHKSVDRFEAIFKYCRLFTDLCWFTKLLS